MHWHPRSILLHVILCSSVHSAFAEPPANHAHEDFVLALDQLFGEMFAETESERDALNSIVVSRDEEKRIGESSLQGVLNSLNQQKVRVLTRGKEVAYLKALISEIHPLMRNAKRYPSIRVYVVDSAAIDARAFPGGSILCSKGLIEFARSEAALIGVLAHELSHIDRGHQLRIVRSSKLAEGMWNFRNSPADSTTGILMAKQFARPFRPEDEAEADIDATKWTFETGYNPREMAELFRRLAEQFPMDPVRMPSFLRTHPYHAERYEAVKQLSSRLQHANTHAELYVGRENLKKRIPRRVKQFQN